MTATEPENSCPGPRNRIARLMRGERLFARQRSKYRHATTDSRPGGPIAPKRVQGLSVQRPNQVWVTDATGVLTGQGWLHLVAVLDLSSRRVGGRAMPRCPTAHRRPAHGSWSSVAPLVHSSSTPVGEAIKALGYENKDIFIQEKLYLLQSHP